MAIIPMVESQKRSLSKLSRRILFFLGFLGVATCTFIPSAFADALYGSGLYGGGGYSGTPSSVTPVSANGAPVGLYGNVNQNNPVSTTTISVATSTNLIYLQSQITILTAQLNALLSQVHPTTPSFTRNLSIKMSGEDVRDLQKFLNSRGFIVSPSGSGSAGQETTVFGSLTQKALIQFQTSIGLPNTGYFGPMTRAKIQ